MRYVKSLAFTSLSSRIRLSCAKAASGATQHCDQITDLAPHRFSSSWSARVSAARRRPSFQSSCPKSPTSRQPMVRSPQKSSLHKFELANHLSSSQAPADLRGPRRARRLETPNRLLRPQPQGRQRRQISLGPSQVAWRHRPPEAWSFDLGQAEADEDPAPSDAGSSWSAADYVVSPAPEPRLQRKAE